MAKEVTETMTAQITYISKGKEELTGTKEQLEKWLKYMLDADDVKVTNLRRFEMDKE